MVRYNKIVYFLISLFFIGSIQAKTFEFYDKKSEGWFWYEELKKKKEKEETDEEPLNPTQTISRFKQQLNEKLNLALVNPTLENVAAYLKMQQQTFDNSNLFATQWKKALLKYPELDSTVKYPVNHTGRQIYLREHRIEVNHKIKNIAKKYGLMFFFSGGCKYCQEFAKTIKSFAANYNWNVMAVSIDGGSLPEFLDAKTDNGIASNLNVFAVPAVILVEPNTNETIPVTFGIISEQELFERIALIFNLDK